MKHLNKQIKGILGKNPKQLVRDWTGLSVYNKLPIGLDPFYDVKRKLPHYEFKTILDVGANIGQTAHEMRKHFPTAEIYCFEPIKGTFSSLKKNTRKLNLNYYNVALGSKNEVVSVKTDVNIDNSDKNSLLNRHTNVDLSSGKAEEVQVLTLKRFCENNRINFIDYLKIDTEGFDLEVLKGSKELLEESSISFIEAEVSMNPKNSFHVDFMEIKSFLEKYDYLLFGVYEQIHERRNKVPMLRRSNVLFISSYIKLD